LKTAIIIPARNEEIPLPGVVDEIPTDADNTIIVVDNGSTDGTASVARQAGAVVVSEERSGYGYACAAGMEAAAALGAEALVFLDGDGSFDPSQIPALVSPIESNHADLVLGSRTAGGMEPGAMPTHARFGNWLVALLMRLLYSLDVTDLGPYRAVRASLLNELGMQEMTYGWPTEMMVKAARRGARVVEIPVRYRVRRGGRSKVSGTLRGTVLATYAILLVTLRHPVGNPAPCLGARDKAMSTPAATLPDEVYIEVTNRCNSRCQTCVRTFAIQEPLRDLELELFRSVVDQIPVLRRVVLHGVGEPLLHPDLEAMISHLKARPDTPHVLFNSNAILLTAERQKGLIEAGVNEFRVSTDAAHRDLYRRIRGVDGFVQMVENVGAFARRIAELGTGPVLSLWFTAMHENLGELPELVRIAHQLDVNEVYVQRLVYNGLGMASREQSLYRAMQATEEQSLREAEVLAASLGITFRASGATTPRDSLLSPDGDKRPWSQCRRPTTLTYISANGNVLPCCFSPFTTNDYQGLILGNVMETPLSEIWGSASYNRFRAALQTDTPPEACRCCGVCWSL
jgi:MoaA/NifB/PqqE/SkfB family radical SAM enzyme